MKKREEWGKEDVENGLERIWALGEAGRGRESKDPETEKGL